MLHLVSEQLFPIITLCVLARSRLFQRHTSSHPVTHSNKPYVTNQFCDGIVTLSHRHLKISRLLYGTYCLPVCFIITVNGHCNKKRKEKKKLSLRRPALVPGTQQTLSNLF